MRRDVEASGDLESLNGQWKVEDTGAAAAAREPLIRSIADLKPLAFYGSQKIDYLVDGLIAAGTVTAVTGEPGCGKTTLTSAIADAVARGVPFAGLATQRRPVLIEDKENPHSVVSERFERMGIRDSENLKIWGGWCEEEPPVPFCPIVMSWVEACTPKPLIVVDSLSAFSEAEENSATETRKFMNGFRHMADAGATVIVLHHSGKADSAQDYRGSSDFKASIDVGYKLTNLGDAARLATLRLKAFKARFTVNSETILRYNEGRFLIDTKTVSDTNANLLQSILVENPGINAKRLETIAGEKGVRRNRVRTFIDAEIAAQHIHVSKGACNAQIFTWIGKSNGGVH